MSGALAGLLGLTMTASACEDGPIVDTPEPAPSEEPVDPAAPAAAGPTFDIVVSTTLVAFEDFVTACQERGGFVQTTAACAGNNACKGFSYIEPTLTEHSCKGLNGCGPGMSCVVLQKDSGRTGKEIYEGEGACAETCHGQFEPIYDPSIYTLYVRPDTLTLEEAEKRFKTGSAPRLYSTVAFGAHGINGDGIAFANMPPHYSKYSRAEIERVVEYIRTIPIQPVLYDISGSQGGH